MPGHTITQPPALSCAPSRAARELGLKRAEFELAVHLGRVRTVPDEGGGGARRVAHAEIERLRAAEGFPEGLRDSVKVVGTKEGAALMEVTTARFTRLARLGLVTPVKFYLNRYRAVVWLYLADEVRQFAAGAEHARLLSGRIPEGLRGQLDAGVDLRPRNWRGRHLGFLLRHADDPWERAGALAALLDPGHLAEIVTDPYERSHVNRFRPGPPAQGAPGSPSAHLAEKITTAADPDEIGWLRADLARTVEEARRHRPAPRPALLNGAPAVRSAPPRAPRNATHAPKRPERARGLLRRLRHRKP
ncbi:DUF6397 family protein [Streptomyces sp. NPDC059582]|uniref:DUF6397 family protein n=1 Tax=Streptomyces sp. NPDC059582 TaxID=3346875 RepID=UPI0036C05F3E